MGRFKTALIKTLEISVLILFVAASNFFGAVFSRLYDQFAHLLELVKDCDSDFDHGAHLCSWLAA